MLSKRLLRKWQLTRHEEIEGDATVKQPPTARDSLLANASNNGGRGDQPQRQSEGRAIGWWDSTSWHTGADQKQRRIQSGLIALANGIPARLGYGSPSQQRMAAKSARANRVGRLKGYGNAIVPQLAAEFIKAFLETENE
jgi:hypothetical protein